jgi:two-component system OmpR family sensor kinase
VPAAEQRRIFEAFHGLREDRRGAGLGLWIARGFLEAHRGDLHVETTNGGGATFVISLPIR